jgi:hypothetical protein
MIEIMHPSYTQNFIQFFLNVTMWLENIQICMSSQVSFLFKFFCRNMQKEIFNRIFHFIKKRKIIRFQKELKILLWHFRFGLVAKLFIFLMFRQVPMTSHHLMWDHFWTVCNWCETYKRKTNSNHDQKYLLQKLTTSFVFAT